MKTPFFSKKTPLHSTARDVFYYLLTIVTLYISVVSFIAILFQYINTVFLDQLDFGYNSTFEIIRNSIAVLFVVWPVYIFMSWLISKDLNKNPEKSEIGVRKWLFYLTLFIASITIIVDLIQLINNFLNGELTIKFFLKTLAIFIVAGVTFGYYLWDLNRVIKTKTKLPKIFAYSVSGIIVIGIIAGLFVVGSPTEARNKRFDEQRINHLQNLQNEIVNYWSLKNVLPATLDALKDPISGFTSPFDPETNKPYEYIIISPLSFNLCAEFKTASKDNKANLGYPTRISFYGDPYNQNWNHEIGKICFTRNIDPEIYKKNNGNPPMPVKY